MGRTRNISTHSTLVNEKYLIKISGLPLVWSHDEPDDDGGEEDGRVWSLVLCLACLAATIQHRIWLIINIQPNQKPAFVPTLIILIIRR